ncbi:MAG: hypothetical protein DRH97_01405 [Chloroflexi bacterium]|nr:MAG: hypothetical protein DRH97_01405 [Chloroflexota bacterium]
MLNIRRFVKGVDEPVWLQVLNAARKEREDWRAITVEDLLADAKRPSFDFEGRFIGELDGKAVGIDDKYNLEKKVQAGEVFTIGVLKAHRRKGIGARLMLHGLERLRARGMTKAILGVEDDNPTQAMRLYEKLGFSVKKRESILEREV